MNFLAHAAVARRATDDPDVVLGSMLPDLLAMSGLRLDRATVPAAVGEGWHLHHRADAAFHALPTFTQGVAAIRADLLGTALGVGSRRAAAHVGWELLLDEAVLDDALVETFLAALDRARALHDDPTWAGLVDRLGAIDARAGADATTIAARVHRAVARRPRLRFESALVGQLATVLEAHRPAIVALAPAVITDVAAAVAA